MHGLRSGGYWNIMSTYDGMISADYVNYGRQSPNHYVNRSGGSGGQSGSDPAAVPGHGDGSFPPEFSVWADKKSVLNSGVAAF